ncbi:PDGLE domain-containing protein [Paenibacillus nasutitermitis]|uniref:PDGLE domain-containing protein n=1 Tax=Paenibacillus nasutitermitis TaxID=1652958 RepID=A0A916ZJJ2_9BACL|nr:PDGLE domain-containing protein [Paenibacillus nasutitermitis]GGD99576.1 hypothetical protein GCM10010911_68130 [Paenibacillus nasutitermitis]
MAKPGLSNEESGKPGQTPGDNQFRVTMSRTKWAVILAVTLIAAGLLAPWASSSPDGLNRVAEDHGFSHLEGSINKWAPLPDYEWTGLSSSVVKVGGLIGVVIMIVALWGFSRALTRINNRRLHK